MDAEVAKAFQRILAKQGLKFILGAAVQSAEPGKDGVTLRYKLRKDDSEATLTADVVLVATGRKPYTAGLGLEALGVEMLPRAPDQGRRPFRHEHQGDLRHRRCHSRPDAGPQGRG